MTDEHPPAEEPTVEERVIEPGPIERIQAILGEFDPEALVVGFVIVTEWLETDGQRALSVMHTPSSAWNLHGMLTYARDQHLGPHVDYEFIAVDDDDEGDSVG